MRTALVVSLSALAAVVLGCGGDLHGSPIVVGDDTKSNPSDPSGADGAVNPVADGGLVESGTDANVADSNLVVELAISTLGQNCMPPVAPDPVTMQAKLLVTNKGTSAVGPITITSAAFAEPDMFTKYATFEASAGATPFPQGTATEVLITKKAGSMMPKSGCGVLACGKHVIIEVSFSGPGIPLRTVRSEAKATDCVF